MSDPVVIVSAARTPMGSFQGDFSSLAAHDLGGVAIAAAIERAGIASELVTEVLLGNCLMAGQGQAPARQAAFKGGLPASAYRNAWARWWCQKIAPAPAGRSVRIWWPRHRPTAMLSSLLPSGPSPSVRWYSAPPMMWNANWPRWSSLASRPSCCW